MSILLTCQMPFYNAQMCTFTYDFYHCSTFPMDPSSFNHLFREYFWNNFFVLGIIVDVEDMLMGYVA